MKRLNTGGRIAAEIPVSPLGGVFLLVFGDPGFKPKIGWEVYFLSDSDEADDDWRTCYSWNAISPFQVIFIGVWRAYVRILKIKLLTCEFLYELYVIEN